MQVEVVATVNQNGSPVTKTFEFNSVDNCETQDGGSIAIINKDGDYIAEFNNWEYWRKTGD
jgi:hypothetical protein